MHIAVSTSRGQHGDSVEPAGGVVQPIGVDLVVERREVRVERDHRHAVWRRLRDDGVNGRLVKLGNGEQGSRHQAALHTYRHCTSHTVLATASMPC